jgi:hypothetical protein
MASDTLLYSLILSSDELYLQNWMFKQKIGPLKSFSLEEPLTAPIKVPGVYCFY